jgi:prepilin-type N-terminal cleavage/methylation domain-containing protein
MNHKRNHGFTLIEIAIVVFIIGVIASIVLVAFNQVQIETRDRKRASDVVAFSAALDKYFQDNNEYPPYLTDPNGFLADLYDNKNIKDPQDNSATALYRTIAGSHYCGLSSQLFWMSGFCTNYIYFSYNGSGTSGFSDAQMGCNVSLDPGTLPKRPGYVIVWYSESRKSIMFSGKNVTVTYQSAPDSHLPGQQCVVTDPRSL